MQAPDLYRFLLKPLHDSGIAYMVTGAVAASAYGEPRLTNDLDLVVSMRRGDDIRLRSAFPEDQYYLPPSEVVVAESARPRHGHFNIMHRESALRADVYLAGDDPRNAEAMTKRIAEQVGGGTVWFAPIEYVILHKLIYYRDGGSRHHVRDIAGILRVSGDRVDRTALDRLVAAEKLERQWNDVLAVL